MIENRPESAHIYLRLMEIADTDKIVSWRNKDIVRNHFIYRDLFTREGHMNWIRTQVEPGYVVQFIICEKAGNRDVGSVYLRDIDREKKCAEFGIFIGEEDALGKGYGTQAADLILNYAFEKMKLRSVFLRVFADNIRARKSYEKAGFRLITDRQETLIIDAEAKEVVFYEIHA